MTSPYYAEIPERPTNVFELCPFDDGTNRGATILGIHSNKQNEPWAQLLQLPSKILSVAGENMRNYTFKTIKKMLTTRTLPIRVRLQPITSTLNNQSSDSESDAAADLYTKSKTTPRSHHKKFNKYSSKHSTKYSSKTTSKSKNKYDPNLSKNNKHRNRSDSNSSIKSISINLANNSGSTTPTAATTVKQCDGCSKSLRQSKQHRCRRCAAVVCSKCSKNKRKEPGYLKLVRVCDKCKKRDEFSIEIEDKPLGIQTGPIYGKSSDLGGILIINVKLNGSVKNAENKNQNIKLKGSVIIAINDINIELLSYNDAIEKLRITATPFNINCKKWNKNTKKSAKNQLEKEHQEMIQKKLAEMQQISANDIDDKKSKKKNKKKGNKGDDDDNKDGSLSPNKHNRNGTVSSLSSDDLDPKDQNSVSPIDNNNNNNQVPLRPTTPSKYKPTDMFAPNGTTSLERYTGSEDIEQHSANQYILTAVENEKNDELDQAVINYNIAIKQFNITLHKIDNNKIKRKWKDKIQDYNLALLRVKRRMKYRRKPKNKKSHGRSQTLAPKKTTRKKSASVDYTANIKSPNDQKNQDNNDQKDDNNSDNKNNGQSKKDKKKNDQDLAFRNRLMGDIISDKPNVSFKDVQGLANVKLAIYETIILPQKRPHLFTGLRTPSQGLLLFGPPGNGKTMIAKCIATEIDSTFFSISASSITSKYVGDAERIMKTLFSMAREKAPSIIFIDEIDSLLTARGGKNEAESSRRIKTEFLVQFDGVKSAKDLSSSILVIGATNLPDQLDEAVLRRFMKRILVPHPEYDTRYGLIRNLMRNEPHEMKEADFVKIAKATDKYSCSDLANLCKDAAIGPVRQLGASLIDTDFGQDNIPKINISHFNDSLKNIRSSLSKESFKYYREWNKLSGSKFSLSISDLPTFLQPNAIPPL